MDRAAIIGDAIEYIGELHQELKNLKDELKEIEEDESKEKARLKSSNLDGLYEGKTYLPPAEHNKRSGHTAERKTEVQRFTSRSSNFAGSDVTLFTLGP